MANDMKLLERIITPALFAMMFGAVYAFGMAVYLTILNQDGTAHYSAPIFFYIFVGGIVGIFTIGLIRKWNFF